jgi:hypothetical protein
LNEKQHICDINIKVYIEQEHWDYQLLGDVEVSYADARSTRFGASSEWIDKSMGEEFFKSALNDRLTGLFIRIGRMMRADFMESKIK